MNIKIGDSFNAIVLKGIYSKTLLGKEAAGRKLGPFVATNITKKQVESDGRVFEHNYFLVEKAD